MQAKNSLNTIIMGVINVTPDSFSDGGKYNRIDTALIHAQQLMQQGADILDIGGESSRPGANSISNEEELNRTIPLIKAIRTVNTKIAISIDTTKLQVMQQALTTGATLINDICALDSKEKIALVQKTNCSVCIVHMQGKPKTMQNNPKYDDVLSDVQFFFEQQHKRLTTNGIQAENIIYDPGFGFGKTLAHNIILFRELKQLIKQAQSLGGKLLIGVSRKTMLGEITLVNNPQHRTIGSISAALLAAQMGVDIVRVHDVKETRQALLVNQVLGL